MNKFCSNCGNNLTEVDVFCGKCGQKTLCTNNQVINNNSYQQNSYTSGNAHMSQNYNLNQNIQKKDSKKTVSLVIGIICIILVFIFQILTMPLSLVGIIFGVSSYKISKKWNAGLILNIISFVIAIPIFIFYSNVFIKSNPTVGTWNCKAFNNGNNKDLEYVLTLKLENNNKFKWYKYNDEKNNYAIGTYEFEDLKKTNNNGTASYYSVKLIGNEFVIDGELQNQVFNSQYEFAMSNDFDKLNEAIVMNANSYNIYYCVRISNF